MQTVSDGLRLIKLSISCVLSTISSIVIYYINLDLISQANSDAMSQLGAGLGKIILLPIYIILCLFSVVFAMRSFFLSIGLMKSQSKALKVIGIVLFILTLALIGFIVFIICQTVKVF